ncbi:MAG: ShlB/FhaC/HecB family hemolysin secretion/activation protein [Verrucomicrobiales bacterium]|nr:ShlB/FhaC/HecB family hemolysin secretion/activation protein [Akkermansiaceae bacterium]
MRQWIKGVAFAAMVPGMVLGQQTVTTPDGTEILLEALPPDQQAAIMQTRDAIATGAGQGPLKVDNMGRFELDPSASAGLSHEMLVDSLRGVVLVPTPGDVRPDGWPGVEGIWHDFAYLPEQVGKEIQGYLGKPVSLASLDEMVKAVILAYRRGGLPVVDVLLPEQDITSGVVQMVVIESKVNRIRVDGVSADMEEYLVRQMSIRPGDDIRSNQILTDLNWINRSPYRKVDLVYSPGSEFGTTDIILKAYESDPNSYYVGYENSGTEVLGEDRFLFGFNFGDAFGPDQAVSYQLSADSEFEKVVGHSLVYTGPLPWRAWMTLLASYVSVNADIPGPDGIPINEGGDSTQLSARYSIPVYSPESWVNQLTFGFDYKSSNNNLEFGGLQVFDVTTEIFQLSAGLSTVTRDKTGMTSGNFTVVGAPGNLTNQNTAEVFERSRAGADPSYVYFNAKIERQQQLWKQWTARLRAEGQLSTRNLLASEQLGAGGYDTVRGFEQRVARGDEGFLGGVEVYTPELSIAKAANWKNETDSLRFLAFYDAATLSNTDKLPDEPNQVELQSVGVGLRWLYSDWFRLRLDYGIPLSDRNLDGIDDGGRWHVGATANF